MKLYWFRNLVQYFPSWDTIDMKYDVTHTLTSLRNEVKGNGHLEMRKMKIKDANLFNTVGFCI
jgi:hypothetical protein